MTESIEDGTNVVPIDGKPGKVRIHRVADPFERKAAEVFGGIIRFIKEHPESCRADRFHFWVGSNYQFWIANGVGHALRAQGGVSIPDQFYTERQMQKLWKAYESWLRRHYPPVPVIVT